MNEKIAIYLKKTDVFVSLRIGFIKILLDKPKSLIRHNVERFVLVNLVCKEIGDEEPHYSTKISIFSFIWAGLAALHKASTL